MDSNTSQQDADERARQGAAGFSLRDHPNHNSLDTQARGLWDAERLADPHSQSDKAVRVTFVGFEFTSGRVMEMTHESKAQRLYRQAYPGDVTLSDLSNWESLEAEHPKLFNNYFFWSQKPADAPIGSSSR